ncbi:pantothenate synthetase [Thiogranum longum]|uniref:Pantothenate synthetase n=1 Tax=Thiogranum longum TaxID=1537524 RepID=A0A4R1HAL7_9GAMM|nr:pantoate--beta-alanine ligase [Thiogranum longum]TCK18997.1 pantothenate synthetase [Thiogranum longum]
METVSSVEDLRAQVSQWRQAGERIALVPTMGNLHDGHLQLVREARLLAPHVVASIFVNPLQFGPNEDLDNYPRTLEADQQKLAAEGVELLFTPDVPAMYPRGAERSTVIEVPEVSEGLCSDFRPGHFTGVATVVGRLFNLVQPDVAVFGEKDYQQLAVIRRMVDDLGWPIEIRGVATVREDDGLAMSSRNQYLDDQERRIAPLLHQTLEQLVSDIRTQKTDYRVLEKQAKETLSQAGFTPEYVEIRHAESLQPVASGELNCVVLAAARLGAARLIDNICVE